MTDDLRTPERRRLDEWSEANPREGLALVMIAAWLNVPVDKLPKELRLHTCEHSKKAWLRVADSARVFLCTPEDRGL